MSINAPEKNFSSRAYELSRDAAKQFCAVTLAYAPTNHLFEIKAAQQNKEPWPRFNRSALIRTLETSPIAGVVVTAQVITQQRIEDELKRRGAGYGSELSSSAFTGVASAPGYMFLNARVARLPLKEYMQQSTPTSLAKEAIAISLRETAFVGSLALSQPLGRQAKEACPYPGVEEITQFSTAALGSLAGHPFDTYLTCSQKKVPIETLSGFFRGGTARSLATGAFATLLSKTRREINEVSKDWD